MIDTIPALVWRADPQGSLEFVNQTWLAYTGLSEDAAYGSGWIRALHPDDVERVLAQWRRLLATGEAGEIEARLRRRDGVDRWFLFRTAPACDDTGNVVAWYGTNIDIEDKKRAEDALRESEQRFRLIVDFLPGLVATMSADGEVEHVNQRVLDYGGATLEELRDWRPWVHPDDLERASAAWGQAVTTGEPYEIEHRLRGADGTHRWFQIRGLPLRDPDGRILRWYILFSDIDDRKRIEHALAESERTLRLLLESIPGMIAVNAADGALDYVNHRLLEFTGKDRAYLSELGWSRILHPEDAEPTVQEWVRCFRTGEPLDVTFRMRRADGVYRWMHARSEPRVDEHGGTTGWYALLWDIEDRKQAEDALEARERELRQLVDDRTKAEEALRRSEAELARVSRIVTMGELTASIAHEVNQPLAAIVNNAGACLTLLANGDAPLDEIHEALTEIVDDARRASAVVARVRKMASKAPLERTTLDLGDVVADVLALTRHESEFRRVTLEVELPSVLPKVLGDRVQLQQVLLNLVVNAMDASTDVPEPQRIVGIRARPGVGDDVDTVVVRVRDAGVGIDSDEVPRLFETFYTTKAQGMGMGLAISRSIIDAHGGRLWVERHYGPGATFLFSLPVVPQTR